MFTKQKEKRKVRSIKFQIELIQRDFDALSVKKSEIKRNFEKSMIGQEIVSLRRTIEEQNLIISTYSFKNQIKVMNAIINRQKNNEIVERKINEKNTLIMELREIDNALMTMKREREEFSKQIGHLQKERRVLAHLTLSSNY